MPIITTILKMGIFMDSTKFTVVKKRKRKQINSKKIIIILLSLAILFATLAVIIHFTTRVTDESYENCAVGDVNGDGKINSSDAARIISYLVGSESLFDSQLKNADVNSDGAVNSLDSLIILRYSTGEISSIPYDEYKERLLNSSAKRKITVTSGNFTSTAQVVNEWDNGDGTFSYQINLTIRNDSDTDSDSWKAGINFDKEFDLSKSWDCNPFVESNSLTVGGSKIEGGDSATCGFIITAKDFPTITSLTVR